MDWADEIAKVFLDNIDANDLDDVSGPASPYTRLATVLRKARAVGMHEAAKETEMAVSANGLSEAIARVRAAASKLERGAKQ